MKPRVQIGDRTWAPEDLANVVADCKEVEPGVHSVIMGTRSYEVRVRGNAVEVGRWRFEAEVIDPRETSTRRQGFAAGGRRQITSPMPGKVIRVLVEEGAEVAAGQGLVVVEAMKMQNEMKASRAGKVIAIAAKPGAGVAAGETLLTLE